MFAKKSIFILFIGVWTSTIFGGFLQDLVDLNRGSSVSTPSTSYTPQGYTPPAKQAEKPGYPPVQPVYQQQQLPPGYGPQQQQLPPGYGPQQQQLPPGYGPQQQQLPPGYGSQQSVANSQDQKDLDVILKMLGDEELFIDTQIRMLTLIPDFPQGVVVPEDLAEMSPDDRKEYMVKFNQANKRALDILKKAAYLKTTKDKNDPTKVIKTMTGEYQVEYEKLNKMKVSTQKKDKTNQGIVKSSLLSILKKVHAPYFTTLQDVMALNKKALEALDKKLKTMPAPKKLKKKPEPKQEEESEETEESGEEEEV